MLVCNSFRWVYCHHDDATMPPPTTTMCVGMKYINTADTIFFECAVIVDFHTYKSIKARNRSSELTDFVQLLQLRHHKPVKGL